MGQTRVMRRTQEFNLDNYPKLQAIILDPVEYAELRQKDKPLYDRVQHGIELSGE